MSGLIHFGSGKTLEITEKEFLALPPKLKNGGVRLVQTTRGDFIPLNSNTMEYVEHIAEIEEVKNYDTLISQEPAEEVIHIEKVDVEAPEGTMSTGEIAKPKETPEEKLAEMVDKSNCLHEPEKLQLYRQHTARGIRYFPVCSFCGKRERYVSESKINKGEYADTVNEKWTDADVAHAEEWVEK
jgi:hypothetical protein